MALQEIRVPHLDTYNFGVGVDRLTGAAMNQVVNPTPSPPGYSGGATQTFVVSRVSTTHDLQQKLGIDVNASYGCASFGAGVSGRFSFAQNSEVHSASLFLTVTASLHLADLSIADCVLTTTAGQHIDRPDIFTARYGNMFARACRRGGLFVGLLSIETFDDNESTKIESELRGSYGMFSADAKANFLKVTSDHKASVYCSLYAEGGPALQLHHPTDPTELLELANTWMKAMFDDPDKYSQPYQWTLSPTSIAEGPLPLNEAEIEHAQDVLVFCAQERATLLDQLNQLNWWSRHQGKYDFTESATPAQVTKGARDTQIDLDTVAACASAAIDSPAQALMPADYAAAHIPPKKYPLSQPPPVGPKLLPGTLAVPQVQVPDVCSMTLDNAQKKLEHLGLTVTTVKQDISHNVAILMEAFNPPISFTGQQEPPEPPGQVLLGQVPAAGTMVDPKSPVVLTVVGKILW